MSTTGGDKLLRSIREARAAQDHTVDIGFRGTNIATLASQHEFGSKRLPERPAMRASIGNMTQALTDNLPRRAPKSGEDLHEVAELMKDEMVKSYENFQGAPLSERQRKRKQGTKGAGRLLVGTEGPKLISHISAFVDDEKIGGL